uniref:Uncharacterized protein n=1 Tax=Parascaris equorum TaxID=6256 RepID=A0A914S1K9_PAREQ
MKNSSNTNHEPLLLFMLLLLLQLLSGSCWLLPWILLPKRLKICGIELRERRRIIAGQPLKIVE